MKMVPKRNKKVNDLNAFDPHGVQELWKITFGEVDQNVDSKKNWIINIQS